MSLIDYVLVLALVYASVLAVLLRRDSIRARLVARDGDAKYLQLFEEDPFSCQEVDVKGIIQRVNKKMCDLRGMEAQSMVGKHYADFAAESDRDRIRDELKLKLSGEAPLVPQKQVFFRKDGSSVTVQVHETLLRDTRGKVVGLRSSALDVTEHIRKEEEIWQTTAELRAIFQALPDKFLRLDMDGTILDYRGPAATTFLGKNQDLVGKSILKSAPEEVARQFEKAILRVRKTSSMVAIESSLPGEYGETFFEARLIPLHWKEIIAIVRDI